MSKMFTIFIPQWQFEQKNNNYEWMNELGNQSGGKKNKI